MQGKPKKPDQRKDIALPDLEDAVVGYLLANHDDWAPVAGMLEPDAFTRFACKEAWRIMAAFSKEGREWTLTDVVRRGMDSGTWPTVAGDLSAVYARGGGTSVLLKRRCEDIRNAWVVRNLQAFGVEFIEDYRAGMDIQEAVQASQANLDKMRQAIASQATMALRSVMEMVCAAIETGSQAVEAVKTGLPSLDRWTGGLPAGCLFVIGARPSTGKTACAVTIAMNAAYDKTAVLFVTTETTKEAIGLRFLAHATKVDSFDIRTGKVPIDDVRGCIQFIPPAIEIWDSDVRLHALTAYATTWAANLGTAKKLLIVDYLELVKAPKMESREREISAVVEELQAFGRRNRVPVLLLSQLSRAAEETMPGTKKKPAVGPTMTHLRYSGMVEQAADIIGLLWHKPDQLDALLEMKVVKNRVAGRTFEIELRLDKGESRMVEVAGKDEFPQPVWGEKP